jgi:hypothetical protein
MDPDPLGRLPQAQAIDDGAGIPEPFLALLQMGQRRAGERIEGAVAGFAFVALHAGRDAPPVERVRAAVAARRRLGELGLDQRNHVASRSLRRQRRHQGIALH